ncbi:MAG TPA: hypothetical protein VGL94_10035 [Ktedonobacteraceae bacterium]
MPHASIKSGQSEQRSLGKWLMSFVVLFMIALLLTFVATTVVFSGNGTHTANASAAIQNHQSRNGNQANQGGFGGNQANQGGRGGNQANQGGFGGNQANQGGRGGNQANQGGRARSELPI